MKSDPSSTLQAHLFICTQQRASDSPKGSCSAKGSEKIYQDLKTQIAQQGLQKKLRAQSTSCLGRCAEGPVGVIYPSSLWCTQIEPEEAPKLLEKGLLLAQGNPLESN